MRDVILHDTYTMPDGSEREHVYTVDGVVKPGISDILAAAGFGQPWLGKYKRASTFGVALHAAIKYDLEGVLGEIDQAPQFQAAFRAYKQFRRDYEPKPIHSDRVGGMYIDRPLYDATDGICGTPDLFCVLNHTYVIIDWKSGVYDDRIVPLKMYAYERIVRKIEKIPDNVAVKKKVVQLYDETPAKGKPYKVISINDQLAETVWRSCMNIYRWKNRRT